MNDKIIPFPQATGSQPKSVNARQPDRNGAARGSQPAAAPNVIDVLPLVSITICGWAFCFGRIRQTPAGNGELRNGGQE